MTDGTEGRVRALTRSQHGLVTRAQLRGVGRTEADIRRLATNGLERLTSQVFGVAGMPTTWERKLHVGLLSVGGEARAGLATAAALLGFEGFKRAGDIHLVVSQDQRVSPIRVPEGLVVHTTRHLPLIDCDVVEDVRITSASRTILDLARSGLESNRLSRAIDCAVRDRRSSPVFLARRLAERRGPGHYGVTVIQTLLRDAGGHSVLERAFLGLARIAGLPRPVCQQVFTRDGRHVARCDFWFSESIAVVEVSGALGHSLPTDRQRDAQRRNELQDLGIKVFEYIYQDVDSRPEFVIGTLRERLGLPPR